jgi:hypothetical protein
MFNESQIHFTKEHIFNYKPHDFRRTSSLSHSNTTVSYDEERFQPRKFTKTSKCFLNSLNIIEEQENTFGQRYFNPVIIISSSDEIEKDLDHKKMSIDTLDTIGTKTKVTINRADCIRKRIKTHFNQFLLKHTNQKIKESGINEYMGKLSQKFIADVKIESNKNYLDLTLKEIFVMNLEGSKNLEKNKRIYERIQESNQEILINYFNYSYAHLYELYLESNHYKNDFTKLLSKEGEYYTNLFKKYSQELIEYYKRGTPYKRKSFFNESLDILTIKDHNNKISKNFPYHEENYKCLSNEIETNYDDKYSNSCKSQNYSSTDHISNSS